MAATYRSISPLSWRPTSRVLGALFAGSAVMFTVAAMQDGPLLGMGDVAGSVVEPLPGGTVTGSSPLPVSTSRDGSALSSGGESIPGTVVLLEGTSADLSPARSAARGASVAPDVSGSQGQHAPWATGATPDWEMPEWNASVWDARLHELAAQQGSEQAAPAPAPVSSAQNRPTADSTDQPNGGVLRDLLNSLATDS